MFQVEFRILALILPALAVVVAVAARQLRLSLTAQTALWLAPLSILLNP
jgi:hypothetical protein